MPFAPARLLLGVLCSTALVACDPFASMSTEEERVVPDDQAANVMLLAPDRRLPASARGVRYKFRRFLDSSLHIRFDARVEEGRQFAVESTGREPVRGYDPWNGHHPDLAWWPTTYPANAEGAEDVSLDGLNDAFPAKIMIQPNGEWATVWLETFGN